MDLLRVCRTTYISYTSSSLYVCKLRFHTYVENRQNETTSRLATPTTELLFIRTRTNGSKHCYSTIINSSPKLQNNSPLASTCIAWITFQENGVAGLYEVITVHQWLPINIDYIPSYSSAQRAASRSLHTQRPRAVFRRFLRR